MISSLFILCGLWAIFQIWFAEGGGLGLTNLNNTFVFGLWIICDLSLIALGSGAFCTALLYYLFKQAHLKPLLPLSVALGLLCYGCAGYILLLEIGQPLRFWFPFAHPNFVSMLTEITFCITIYSVVLLLEFLPVLFSHKQLRSLPAAFSLRQKLLLALPALALAGTLLSLMHQGSLGGVYGALFARPFAFRPGLGIWPWTFVLFIVSAMSAGPLFVSLVAMLIEKLSGEKIMDERSSSSLAKFAVLMLGLSLVLRVADLLIWANLLLPEQGLSFSGMFHGLAYGEWLIWTELLPLTLLPLILLAVPGLRAKPVFFSLAGLLACAGLVLNRYITNMLTLAVPTLPPAVVSEKWELYWPNFIEIAPALMALGIFVLGLYFLYKQRLLTPDQNLKPPIKKDCLISDASSQ